MEQASVQVSIGIDFPNSFDFTGLVVNYYLLGVQPRTFFLKHCQSCLKLVIGVSFDAIEEYKY